MKQHTSWPFVVCCCCSLFKEINLFLSSGTDVTTGFPTMTLQYEISRNKLSGPHLFRINKPPPNLECIQLKEHLCSLKSIIPWLQIIQILSNQGPTVSLEIQPKALANTCLNKLLCQDAVKNGLQVLA